MQSLKRIVASVLLSAVIITANAQYADSTVTLIQLSDSTVPKKIKWVTPTPIQRLSTKSLIIPVAMMTYGLTTLGNNGHKGINEEFNEEVWTEHPHKLNHMDTYLQFAPAVSVYALNAFGIKGKNNFRDRTMIYLMSNIFVNAIVYPTKKIAHQLRPDGSNYNSFPSGHTAEAFASAEFMRQEYKDVSPWYGVAGYAMAATTGYLRMYNQKHWFSDVIAGAGVGIFSTKLAYWLYPKIQHSLFKDKHPNTVVMPTYQNGSFGVGMVHKF